MLSGFFITSLYIARIARFLICGRECLSMAVNSGVRSRASSGVTICDSPSKVTEISAGEEPKS
jgi:hypothetical protein